jgi:RNA polymerase sigma-70 factor (ECF subfamily)
VRPRSEAAIGNSEQLRQQEFERVAMVHTASLLRTAVRLCHEREAAEDLVQEALLRAWRAFDQFEPGTNCKAWLFRIMLNVSSRGMKKLNGGPYIISLDEQAEWKGMATAEADPLQHADLKVALDAMAEEHRVVLLLAVVEGFTCKEISKILAVPIGTVMSRLSRARLGLRKKLSEGERRPARSHAARYPQQTGGMIQ